MTTSAPCILVDRRSKPARRAQDYTMPGSCNPLFASEVIDCVAESREPTARELYAVAERIGLETGNRSAFSLDEVHGNLWEEPMLLRAARLALCGDGRAI